MSGSLAIAAALAMTGPRTTAFAARCAELRADDPALACTRVRRLRVGGHPVEIWRTMETPDADGLVASSAIQLFVAVETQAGWYVSEAAFTVETEQQGEHCSSSSTIDRFDAAAARIDGHHAARVELMVDWSSVCPVSDYLRRYGRIYRTAVCVVDDGLVPRCDTDDS